MGRAHAAQLTDEFGHVLLLRLGTLGVASGAAVALIFDRVLSNRSGPAIAEHEQTHHHDDGGS